MVVHIFLIDSMFYENSEIEFRNSSAENTVSQFVEVVNLDNMEQTLELCKQKFQSPEVTITIVDMKCQRTYYETLEGITAFGNFKNLTQIYNIKLVPKIWEDYIKELTFISEDDYIFANAENFTNLYEMALLHDTVPNINFFYVKNITSFDQILDCQSPLNIFMFSKQNPTIKNTRIGPQYCNNEDIKWLLKNGFDHLRNCIIAGFLRNERFVQKDVPAWTFQVENFFMKGIIIHNHCIPRKVNFGLEDNFGVAITQETFNTSTKYREIIIKTMITTLYFFILYFNNNEIIVEVNEPNDFENLEILDSLENKMYEINFLL